jgi:hypothetical protein
MAVPHHNATLSNGFRHTPVDATHSSRQPFGPRGSGFSDRYHMPFPRDSSPLRPILERRFAHARGGHRRWWSKREEFHSNPMARNGSPGDGYSARTESATVKTFAISKVRDGGEIRMNVESSEEQLTGARSHLGL